MTSITMGDKGSKDYLYLTLKNNCVTSVISPVAKINK